MADVAAIVLAAGSAARFRAAGGVGSKLVAPLAGKPLVRHAVDAALGSRARPIVVVTGSDRDAVAAALAGSAVAFVHNPDFAAGLASSLKAGIAALPADAAGAIILLGDMPDIAPSLLDRLIDAFAGAPDALAAAPFRDGRRGNPALLARALFPRIATLQGDEGARALLDEAAPGRVVAVGDADAGTAIDVDTPAALAEARARMER
jgi:molybdenum cofactor cytidylyltransferase